jgi:hypothetical protein
MDEEDMDKEENNSVTNHVKMEEDKNSVTNNVEIEEDQNSVSTTGEVSASVPESCDDVEKRIQAKAEIHFELQQKHIQVFLVLKFFLVMLLCISANFC